MLRLLLVSYFFTKAIAIHLLRIFHHFGKLPDVKIQKQADAEKARADEAEARADKYEKMLRELGML